MNAANTTGQVPQQQQQQQQAPQQDSPGFGDYAQSAAEKYAQRYAREQVNNYFNPPVAETAAQNTAYNAAATQASQQAGLAAQASWNAGATAYGTAQTGGYLAGTAAGSYLAGTGVASLANGMGVVAAGQAVPAGWVAVGTAAQGGTLVAPQAAVMGSQALASGGTAAGASSGSSAASAASSSYAAYAGIAAAVIAAYLAYRDRSKVQKQQGGGSLTDDEIRMTMPGGAWLTQPSILRTKWNYDPARLIDKQLWGSTKSDGQIYRDRVRKSMKGYGLLDDKYNLTLADGTKFDFGLDGGARLTNAKGEKRRYQDVDFSDKLAADSVWKTNPLGYLFTAGRGTKDMRTETDIVGALTNAVTQNSKTSEDVDKKIRDLYAKAGFRTRQDAYAGLDGLVKAKRINEDMAAKLKNGVNPFLPDAAQVAPPQNTKPIPRTGKAPPNYRKGPVNAKSK